MQRFHRKEEVKAGGRYTITLEEDQKLYHMARLEISKVVTGDKGEYRAVARNQHGEGVATINLNFEGNGKPKYIFTIPLHIYFFPGISIVFNLNIVIFLDKILLDRKEFPMENRRVSQKSQPFAKMATFLLWNANWKRIQCPILHGIKVKSQWSAQTVSKCHERPHRKTHTP